MTTGFLPQRGNYRDLLVYRKVECIYDVTYYFAHQFLERGDRTVDQMVQAARSGKQNIVEAAAASTTSRETELKLTGVARAAVRQRSDEAVANIAITLIHQADVMLRRPMDHLKRDFLEGGGIREEMTRARLAYRRRQELNGANGANE